MKRATIVAALSMAAVFAAVGGEQLMNLPPPPKGGRFTTPTDLVWPEKPGEADICLWSGDRFAACSITIDDNCKPDHEWWLKLSEELGIKLTWFVITDHCVYKKNAGFNGTWADWQKLADAYGVGYYKAQNNAEFDKVFKEAFESKKPCIVDSIVDIDEMILPMAIPGKPIDDQMMSWDN